MTMINNIYHQGNFKVMVNFHLGDLTTLKHSLFLLAIQGLFCISDLALLNTLQLTIFKKKSTGDLDLDDLCFHQIWHLFWLCAFYIRQMRTYCDYSLKVTIVQNFMKIVEITPFLRNSTHHVRLISKILSDLESRSQKL